MEFSLDTDTGGFINGTDSRATHSSVRQISELVVVQNILAVTKFNIILSQLALGDTAFLHYKSIGVSCKEKASISLNGLPLHRELLDESSTH